MNKGILNENMIIKTSDDSPLYLLYSEKDGEEEYNGLILEKDTNKVVCACQQRLKEVSDVGVTELIKRGSIKRLEYCEDGTVIRLYNYKGEWHTATTKCIDANRSYWSSRKSFGKLFWDVFDKQMLPELDPGATYIFILLHTDNRIVVKHQKNSLVYVSKIDNETYTEDFKNVFRNTYGIKRPKQLDISMLHERLGVDDIANMFHPYKRGFIIKTEGEYYKFDFNQYNVVKKLRGNVSDIRYRYIQLLDNPEALNALEYYYSENMFLFAVVKKCVFDLIKNIYAQYVRSHKTHEIVVTEDDHFYRTLKQLHAQYKQSNNSITYSHVFQKIISMDKPVLWKLLKWVD
uniref:T4 RNA ligase 1-like N-terminal domain-containing protein n=1 Tax=viral metagenome TaxID=1070528 RepID=A0A6C0E103_9ZZZZ